MLSSFRPCTFKHCFYSAGNHTRLNFSSSTFRSDSSPLLGTLPTTRPSTDINNNENENEHVCMSKNRKIGYINLGSKKKYLKTCHLMDMLVNLELCARSPSLVPELVSKNKIDLNSLVSKINGSASSGEVEQAVRKDSAILLEFLHSQLLPNLSNLPNLPTHDILLLLQHDPVYTNGRRNHSKVSLDQIARLKGFGAEYYNSPRGGEITYHGHGQLVVYPIMDLKLRGLRVHQYVHKLEDTIIDTLASLGIPSFTTEQYPGVWSSAEKKIAATGCHINKFVSSHGLALNVHTDLEMFSHIVPCGLLGKSVSRVVDLLPSNPNNPSHLNPDTNPNSNTSSNTSGNTSGIVSNEHLFNHTVDLYLDSFSNTFQSSLVPLADLNPQLHQFITEFMHT
ncbi:hypothetical protein BB560_007190 [Smittium megazygosporum]|uniref:lipoyl(octanoyl) transferase n=1 Tax=Smittium megazygosporum TaxID=133381 RepID=A0A2T9XY81_9FUNG|nr:hypothetical protein BB560_007190 [Smittium megazygosporum]